MMEATIAGIATLVLLTCAAIIVDRPQRQPSFVPVEGAYQCHAFGDC